MREGLFSGITGSDHTWATRPGLPGGPRSASAVLGCVCPGRFGQFRRLARPGPPADVLSGCMSLLNPACHQDGARRNHSDVASPWFGPGRRQARGRPGRGAGGRRGRASAGRMSSAGPMSSGGRMSSAGPAGRELRVMWANLI
jgi:hypothetical protein